MTTSALSETYALFVEIVATTPTTGSGTNSTPSPQDESPQLSPLAEILRQLHQLLQHSPTEYAKITQQIATNLQAAANTAEADGNSTAASQLSQLAADFTNASQSGQLPNAGDLAATIFGGYGQPHHGHEHQYSATDSSDTSSQPQTQNDALNPVAIILNTLSSVGTSSSNG
jgi:hypothetical protein